MSLINRSTRLLLAVCAISLIVAPSRASGQGTTGTISGVVSDSSGTPVVGARVSVDGLNLATSSGQTGRYTLTNVPAGTQTVRARLLGYRLTQAADDRHRRPDGDGQPPTRHRASRARARRRLDRLRRADEGERDGRERGRRR